MVKYDWTFRRLFSFDGNTMKALIGIDGSAGSFEAVTQAARLLDPASDNVVLYYSPPKADAGSSQIDPQILERGRVAMAEVVFDAARQRLPAALLPKASTMIGTQNARQGVLLAAESADADLIAVGARGMGPIERLLLGSTSQSVVQSARVPVLVARPGPSAAADSGLRVLLACDGSQRDGQLAAVVNSLTWPAGTATRVITVVESLYAGEVPDWLKKKTLSPETEAMAQAWQHEFDTEKQKLHEQMRGYCQRLPEAFRCDPLLEEGHAAQQILKQIDAFGANLVIVGARAIGPVARWLLGSTSEKVLMQAPCSVLVVREQGLP
jgi:nucleotide-binding universal stress UspA family protein